MDDHRKELNVIADADCLERRTLAAGLAALVVEVVAAATTEDALALIAFHKPAYFVTELQLVSHPPSRASGSSRPLAAKVRPPGSWS